MELKHQLNPHLKHLRLSGILETLDVRSQQAIEGKWSYFEFLSRLMEDEVERRAQKQLGLRLRRGLLDPTKTLKTFGFDFNPTLNRQHLLALATCDYIRQKRNVLICEPTGVGKSHLAQALGHEACRQGSQALSSIPTRCSSTFGLKPLQPPSPEDLYDVINERYERGSILLTSNRALAEWPGLFQDPLLASAGLDRLTHRAQVLIIRGKSFRAKDRQQLEQEVLSSQ